MSHLSSDVMEVYAVVIKDEEDNIVKDCGDFDYEDLAVEVAKDAVQRKVESTNKYHYAMIEHRILPRYI